MRIGVIGGSASLGYALSEGTRAWPEILAENIGQSIELIKSQAPLLTIARGTTLIADFPQCDILILHFATSIGWPEIHRSFQKYLVHTPNPQTKFHLPPHLPESKLKRGPRFFKRLFRACVKYVAFPFGLYKPRNNINDLDDQIHAALSIAQLKAPVVVWLQHNALMVNRLYIERRTYRPFYDRVISIIKGLQQPQVSLLELPKEFLIEENFLWDGVHLSPLGHQKCAELVVTHLALSNYFRQGISGNE